MEKKNEGEIKEMSKQSRKEGTVGGRRYLLYSLLAGTFGALSAVVGKLAFAHDNSGSATSLSGVVSMFFALVGIDARSNSLAAALVLGLRAVSLAANGYCTAQMWRWYVRALSCGSTPVCQVVNTGANFGVSAILGFFVFHEVVTITWLAGALLVVVGLMLVVSDTDVSHE